MQTCVDGIGLQLINQFIRFLKSRSGLLRNNLGLPITGTNCSSSSILLSDFESRPIFFVFIIIMQISHV